MKLILFLPLFLIACNNKSNFFDKEWNCATHLDMNKLREKRKELELTTYEQSKLLLDSEILKCLEESYELEKE